MTGLPTEEIPALKELEAVEEAEKKKKEKESIKDENAEGEKTPSDKPVLMVETINIYNESFETSPEIKVGLFLTFFYFGLPSLRCIR